MSLLAGLLIVKVQSGFPSISFPEKKYNVFIAEIFRKSILLSPFVTEDLNLCTGTVVTILTW